MTQSEFQRRLPAYEAHYRTVATTLIVILVGWAVSVVQDIPTEVKLLGAKVDFMIQQSDRRDDELQGQINELKRDVERLQERSQRGDGR